MRDTGHRDHGLYRAASAIELIADALRDPDLSTQTTLRLSPDPNVLQKEHFAERYLRFGRPTEALAWLGGDWKEHNDRRERLLSEAYWGHFKIGKFVHVSGVAALKESRIYRYVIVSIFSFRNPRHRAIAIR